MGQQLSIGKALGAIDDKIECNRRAVSVATNLLDALAEKVADSLALVPLGSIATLARRTLNPATLGDDIVAHFSLPAFDVNAQPDMSAASAIMSNKLVLTGPSILVSRLNPRINRTWWAVPPDGHIAVSSTEFAVLGAASHLELAALWLAVRDPFFRDELPRRVTGTSGSHQRVRPEDLLCIEVPDVRQLDMSMKATARGLLKVIQHHREESARLANLRDTLLPELLSGRIRAAEVAA
jgi:type I restriction enzyme S subunit